MKELMLEGVCGIVEGLNPKLIRSKLEAYSHGDADSKQKQARTSKEVERDVPQAASR